jgi:hypothetical protein
MIFCCDFFYRNSRPKFYEKTVSMMRSADGHAFYEDSDMTEFVDHLRNRIEKDKPVGHSARLIYRKVGDDGRGHIFLQSGRDETDIARLYLHTVKSIYTYGWRHFGDLRLIRRGGEV